MINEETMAVVRQLHLIFSGLSGRERQVFLLRSGILTGKNETLEFIGKELGVTRERIRQIEAKVQMAIDRNISAIKGGLTKE